MIATLFAWALAVAPPPFVAAPEARTVSALLGARYRALEQRDVQVERGGAPERVVVVGAPSSGGDLRAVGLIVCRVTGRRRTRRFAVMASARLPRNPTYEFALADRPLDLDGDGHLELAVDERVAGAGMTVHGRTYWRRDGERLRRVYHVTLRYERGARRVERTMRVDAPHRRIVETITESRIGKTGRPTPERKTEVILRLDQARGRFAPVRMRVLP